MKEFAEKTAVVVGATSGIGVTIAESFANEGARVAVVGRNEERGRAVADGIAAKGGTAEFFRCDITCEESIAALMNAVKSAFGSIDVMVGNAAIPEKKVPLDQMTDTDFRDFLAVIDTDLVGIIQCTRYAIRHMLQNPGPNRGAIVNVASVAGVVVTPLSSSYPASKAGIIHFTRAQAVQYITQGIRLNCISPGYVATPLLDKLPPDIISAAVAKHPIGRFGTTQEMADAVLYLCSGKASFVVGHNLVVDGGYTLV